MALYTNATMAILIYFDPNLKYQFQHEKSYFCFSICLLNNYCYGKHFITVLIKDKFFTLL